MRNILKQWFTTAILSDIEHRGKQMWFLPSKIFQWIINHLRTGILSISFPPSSHIYQWKVCSIAVYEKKCLYKLIKKKAHPGSHFFFFCSSSNNKDLSVKTVEVCVKQMKKLKQITIKLFHHGSTKEGMTILSRWKKAWKKSYSH